ncbi:MAG: nicotinate-nucleotide--dimethylbenzimidazole phosphoribosyltransferase [Woeseiaceae bacterium]
MNQDTLWLQVPAAKIHPVNWDNVSNVPDKLEDIAIRLASLQGSVPPCLDKINVILFIADHGVINQDEITLAQPITTELLNNFSRTDDIIHIMANKLNAKLEVVNLGTKINLKSIDGIIHSTIATSTANFCHAQAMNNEQLARAINIGRQSIQRIHLSGAQLFVAREINRANTLSALAITCALLNIAPEEFTPNDEKHNKDIIKLVHKALTQHKDELTSPLEILQRLGSFEIAALIGSYLCCAHIGIPVLIDGFASAVAAFITIRLCPGAEQWFLYSQTPNNPAHKLILDTLKAQPLLQLKQNIDNMASITTALSLLHLACTSHNQKRSFSKEELLKRYF